jgi:fatty acid desaturase
MADHFLPDAHRAELSTLLSRPGASESTALQGSARVPSGDYTQLKLYIKQQGLLDRQVGYYIYQLGFVTGLLLLSLGFLLLLPASWAQFLNAAFLAFISTQICFIGHDACHRQIFRLPHHNDWLGLILGNLLLGFSRMWWTQKHNLHHGKPNQLDLDPDIDIPLLAFSEEQACTKQGVARFVVKYQTYFFVPLLAVEALHMQLHSMLFLVRERFKYRGVEMLLLGLHVVLYVGLLLRLLGPGRALIFILIHQGLSGIYLGLSFAANHKGMLLLEKDHQMDFLRQQVLTTRNLTFHTLTDFVFGPLACQIEHHLFPTMPRNKLRETAEIVRAFCQERSIAYYETGVVQSYREIFQHLHLVGAPLRAARRP